jgi:hypothetical protein
VRSEAPSPAPTDESAGSVPPSPARGEGWGENRQRMTGKREGQEPEARSQKREQLSKFVSRLPRGSEVGAGSLVTRHSSLVTATRSVHSAYGFLPTASGQGLGTGGGRVATKVESDGRV